MYMYIERESSIATAVLFLLLQFRRRGGKSSPCVPQDRMQLFDVLDADGSGTLAVIVSALACCARFACCAVCNRL